MHLDKKGIVRGTVTSKRAKKVSMNGWGNMYYVTIADREFAVSIRIYERLSHGDYVSATYKRGGLFGEECLIKLLDA